MAGTASGAPQEKIGPLAGLFSCLVWEKNFAGSGKLGLAPKVLQNLWGST